MSSQRRIDMERLLDRSSLGTPAAKQIRSRTPATVSKAILRESASRTHRRAPTGVQGIAPPRS